MDIAPVQEDKLTNYSSTSSILEQIRSDAVKGRWRGKIKSLMGYFGSKVPQRVHGSSWRRVEESLKKEGIAIVLTSPGKGESANDWVELTWPEPIPKEGPPVPRPQVDEPPPLKNFAPLPFLFNCSDSLDETDSARTAVDILNAVWACRTVCLLVGEASDDYFNFLCAFFSAILRRRAEMIRWSSDGESLVRGVDIIGEDQLRRFVSPVYESNFETRPVRGSVYLIRETANEPELDVRVDDVRDSVLPHTYKLLLNAEFVHTSAMGGIRGEVTGEKLEDMQSWFRSFAGVKDLKSPGRNDGDVDIGRLLVETIQLRDSLQGLEAHAGADKDLKVYASESTEHMVLKCAVMRGLRHSHPLDKISMEKGFRRDNDIDGRQEEGGGQIDGDGRDSDRPDISISKKLWVEIETLRWISSIGSDPFLSLEAKLRQKTKGMKDVEEIWLLVPSDVAALATNQVIAIARNLNAALGADKVRPGFVDMISGTPVFFEIEVVPTEPPTRYQLRGTPREHPRVEPQHHLALDDIAGYSNLKSRIKDDILAPLTESDKYRRHGQLNASGLLLYGLPGCGKTLMGQVIAGEAGRLHRSLMPSDLTSMWLGEGVAKTRELFDWALKHSPCLLIIDELDAIAPQRRAANMHTDEMRQVNELLTQLDRISNSGVMVVATTNYPKGIDSAIQRSGRFDLKIPVFPPTEDDRAEIFRYYLTKLKELPGISACDIKQLAKDTPLFSPADIKALVNSAARKAIRKSSESEPPALTHEMLLESVGTHPRSIRTEAAEDWLKEVTEEISPDNREIEALQRDIETVRKKAAG